MYKTYIEAKKKNLINSNTIIEVYSYPYITSLINELESMSYIHKFYASLIETKIFGVKNKVGNYIIERVDKEGEEYIDRYLKKKNSIKIKKNKLKNINYKDSSHFNYIKELDNHYLFSSKEYFVRALMAKKLKCPTKKFSNK